MQQACDAADDPYGANAPYLYWVLNPGGNSTISPNPVLTLSGSGSATAIGAPTSGNSSGSSAVKFVTPYFTPDSSLIAQVSMNVLTIDKKSSWNLVISHGCGGGDNNNPPASDLIVFKTAQPAANLTYNWDIQKVVDGASSQNIADGGSATFNYVVSVSHDAGTLSGWTVTGDVTVTNPNLDAVNNVSVTDAIQSEPNASCVVSNGQPGDISPSGGSVPGGFSVDYPYTCTYSAAPAADVQTNEADVSYPSQNLVDNGPLSGNTLPGTASFSWTDNASINATNDTVSVGDSQYGPLGTVSASTDPNPTTFDYSLSFDGNAGTCTDYPNTATLYDANSNAIGDSSASVTVCDGSNLGVTKTATPSFTRTYTWGIQKSVDNSQLNIPSGGTATSNYTVSVTHDGGTDSGWKVDGTITVTNPNDWESVTLTGVSDAIDNGGNCSITSGDPNAEIPAGGSVQLGYECTYPSDGPSAADFTNTATATWDASAASTPDGSASGQATGAFGDPTSIVDGSVDVTDSLQGDLGTVSYTDESPKLFTYSIDRSGEAGTCKTYDNTASYTTSDTQSTGSSDASVQVCDGSDLTASKTANPSFTRTYAWGITKASNTSQINTSGSAVFNYTVSVTHDAGTDSGWQVNGVITVNNPNDWEAVTANVSDAVDNGGSCSITGNSSESIPNGASHFSVAGFSSASVPAGGSTTFDYTCTYASAPSPLAGTNTATVSWDSGTASTPDDSTTATKSFDFGSTTPTLVDSSVSVTDTFGGTLGTVSYTDPSPTKFHYSHTFSGDPAGKCTNHKNTATFTTNTTATTGSASKTVKVCVGADLTVSKTATPSFKRTYTWGITKAVDHNRINTSGSATANYTVSVTHNAGTDSNWQVKGTITVHNPNNWEAITVNVTDAVNNGGTCVVTGGTGVSIAASASQTFSYTCTYSSAPSPLAGTNTATAAWNGTTAATPHSSATGTASFNFGTTTPTIVNGSVSVSDTLGGSLGTVSYTDPSPKTFTYSLTFNDPAGTCTTHPNTASYTTNTTHSTGSSSKSVKVCVGEDLAASKTATPSFTRTYHWGISKSVDKTKVDQASGSVVFNYVVSVTHDSGTDSGWQVNGSITVSNPNDWEAITGSVSDAVDNGGSCTITGSSSASIPASGSHSFPYKCTYTSAPSPAAGTNTATVTWNSGTAFTPDASAQGQAGFDFASTSPTLVHDTVTINDTLEGNLGTVSYTDPSPTTFSYSNTVPVTADQCTTVNNTAQIVETGQSASKSVQVCGPVSGEGTMGYWQNNNGQAEILGGHSTGGVCDSGTYLRTFAPFQDLSPTASCSDVASYFITLFNAANAGGASMNAMLKGQMATLAFDVFFGHINGNDMVDLSGASAAFGGSSCMKITDALSYAASKSNVGGSVWYSQNKTTQGLAEGKFDQINEGNAWTC